MGRRPSIAAALAHLLLVADASADDLECQRDDALTQTAANVLLGNVQPDAAQLTREAHAAGSDAVSLHALLVPPQANARAHEWLRDLRARSDSDLVCGIADSATGRLLIASPRAGSLAPISARERIVRGSVRVGFDKPELVIASGDGALTRVGAPASALERGITLPADLKLPIKVQLVARGPHGPRPVAERVVGQSADEAAPAITGHASDNVASEVDDLATLLSQLREARGRPRVRDNRLLRQAANVHARRVCDERRVAHEIVRGNGPEARLADAGLTARLVGEAIARASSASEALDALVQSPSHLLTLLEPRFTDVGIGRARDTAGKSCFVVLLSAWPRYRGR